ncbi:hypothetical protein K2P97_05730 [bacterium]|nr:hypothetical protein [bacterium]
MHTNPLLNFLSKWINHPAYFLFCFTIALFAWSFSFESKQPPEQIVLSSFATNIHEIKKQEESVIERLPSSNEFNKKSKLPKRFRRNPAFQAFEKFKEITE